MAVFKESSLFDVFLENTSIFEQTNLTTKFDPNHEFFDRCRHQTEGRTTRWGKVCPQGQKFNTVAITYTNFSPGIKRRFP